MSPFEAATLDLPATARLLIPVLKRLARGHAECWASNESLMRAVRCCERALRQALAALEGANLVRRVRDYTLRSRRRIVLLWMAPSDCFPFMTANMSPDSAHNFAARSAPPPHPPIKGPEGNTEKSDGRTEPTEPPPHEVASLVEKARRSLPADPAITQRVAAWLKRWPVAWISAGLDRVFAKQTREPVDNPTGYLFGVLSGYQREGGPPPPKPVPTYLCDVAEQARRNAEFTERYLAMLAAESAGGGTGGAP